SCRHSHSHALQQRSHATFSARGTLPYHSAALRVPGFEFRGRAAQLGTRNSQRDEVRGFGARLNPATLSARAHSTSELLRTLSRMAASKPTSWLSGRAHILCY